MRADIRRRQFSAEDYITSMQVIDLIAQAEEQAGIELDDKQLHLADIAAAVVCFENNGEASVLEISTEWKRHPILRDLAKVYL